MLFEMARALRSLSLADWAVGEARREANRYILGQPHRADGGAADGGKRKRQQEGFVLPSDINAISMAAAIRGELLSRRADRMKLRKDTPVPLVAASRGRVVVPEAVMLVLGCGDAAYGERVLRRLIDDQRRRCVVNRLTLIRGYCLHGKAFPSATAVRPIAAT
jgi:hypothetical protein